MHKNRLGCYLLVPLISLVWPSLNSELSFLGLLCLAVVLLVPCLLLKKSHRENVTGKKKWNIITVEQLRFLRANIIDWHEIEILYCFPRANLQTIKRKALEERCWVLAEGFDYAEIITTIKTTTIITICWGTIIFQACVSFLQGLSHYWRDHIDRILVSLYSVY